MYLTRSLWCLLGVAGVFRESDAQRCGAGNAAGAVPTGEIYK